MSKVQHASWIVSPKSLIGMLGAEYGLMRDGGVLKRFYVSSILIMLILLLTGLSIFYAIKLLFHSLVVEILLAAFFCLLFVCIYIFLLNTFAKESRSSKGILTASNIIRMGFIVFMGFQVAQPLLILLYNGRLSLAVEAYKSQLLIAHTGKIDHLVNDEIKRLQASQIYYNDQKELFGTHIYDRDLAKINTAISALHEKNAALKTAAKQTIEGNSFFLYQVGSVNRKYPLSWLLTLAIIVLFLLPGYLIYSISSQNDYYRLKKAHEKELILGSYSFFQMWHKILFNAQVEIFTRYEDPPFNTRPKQPPIMASNSEFLKKYLDIG